METDHLRFRWWEPSVVSMVERTHLWFRWFWRTHLWCRWLKDPSVVSMVVGPICVCDGKRPSVHSMAHTAVRPFDEMPVSQSAVHGNVNDNAQRAKTQSRSRATTNECIRTICLCYAQHAMAVLLKVIWIWKMFIFYENIKFDWEPSASAMTSTQWPAFWKWFEFEKYIFILWKYIFCADHLPLLWAAHSGRPSESTVSFEINLYFINYKFYGSPYASAMNSTLWPSFWK